MKKLLVIFYLIFLCTFSNANEKVELEKHFLNKIDDVILIVKDKSLTKDVRNEKIVNVLTPMFDFTLMAKLSLGKTWKTLKIEQKTEFVNLYVKRMKKSYSSKLDSYSDEKIKITDIKQVKSNRIEIQTDLITTEQNLQVSYKFYKPKKQKTNKDKWLIYDVEILGVSILKTDKAQFKEYLKNKTIYDLMDQMKKS